MDRFVAALPMYDWPEARGETDALWVAIRDALRRRGIAAPDSLARCNADLPAVPGGIQDAAGSVVAPDPAGLPPDELDFGALWHHPALLFAQTCWGPMELGLARHVSVVGQPDYSAFDGGEGELYSSAILMRSGPLRAEGTRRGFNKSTSDQIVGAASDGQNDRRTRLAANGFDPILIEALRGRRFAFNSLDSMSGIIALARDLKAAGESLALFSETIETGAHRASIAAVAEGRADVCTVDCRTWDLAKRFEPRADDVAVVGWTAKRKGLPYITSPNTPPEAVTALRNILQALPSSLASSG